MTEEELKAQQAKDEEILKPKTEEELRQEIIDEFQFDSETEAEKIDRILEYRKDRYSATRAKREAQEGLKTAQEAAKTAQEAAQKAVEEAQKPKELKEQTISQDDRFELIADGHSKEAIKYLEDLMKVKGITEVSKALEDPLFTTWQANNEAIAKRRGSQLPPSRGGGAPSEPKNEFVEKFSKNLPPGFTYKP